MTDLKLLEELKKIDAPTITNVVATYREEILEPDLPIIVWS